MLFCTIQYVLFLAAVFAVYWSLPSARARVWLLLAASVFFYASWNKWLALLITITTLMDYLLALAMEDAPIRRRKLLLIVSLVMNLGVLVTFKYADFFLDSLRVALHAAGMSASIPVLSMMLPIGISFYTFEAINYTVDVYRGRIRAERDLGHFMLFILFFPHLVAGPIVRAKDFLPQIRRPKVWNWPRMGLGLWLIVLGTFKKLAIADRMALFVDPVFAEPWSYSGVAIWLATVAFALQVYCDFSGYSDIALGSAHLLGYKLAINFRLPFIAVNMADFWRRWHISLSTWLRDYLFIPLGGSKGSRWATCRNLIIVMTIGGLWHGATWNCVLWGFAIGVLLAGHKCFADACRSWPTVRATLQSTAGTAARIALTFATFVLTLAIFRSASLHDALTVFERMAGNVAGLDLPLPRFGLWATLGLVALGHLLGWLSLRHPLAVWRLATRVPASALGLAAAVMLNFAILVGPVASKAFIYFQF